MAKQPLGVFAKTETHQNTPADNTDLDNGIVRPLGVGLREGEIAALDDIAGQLGVTRNALLRFAARWFIMQFRAGKVDPANFVETPPEPRKRLRMPK